MSRRNGITRVEAPRPSKRRRALEWSKTALIALLVVSAIFLTGRCLLYSGAIYGGQDGWFSTLIDALKGTPDLTVSERVSGRPMDAAARIALCGGAQDGQGNAARLGLQYDAEGTKRLSDSVVFHLSSALASARTPYVITEQDWRGALGRAGIYFELLGAVPLRAMNAWQKEGTVNLSLPEGAAVRRLLLAYRDGETATLYYSNESDGLYYACETAVIYEGAGGLKEKIESELTKSGPNGATFAFERQDTPGYDGLDPYVMITDPLPARVYRSSNPVPVQDETRRAALQEALSFPSHYLVGGEVVIWEGNEKLRLSGTGVATYQAAAQTEPRYPVDSAGTVANASELIEAARRVADTTVGAWCGAAQLYLDGIAEQEDGSWEIRFGYSLNGSAVLLPGGEDAAVFTVRDGRIDAFTLVFRAYEDMGVVTPILPINQAVAAMGALHPAGGELVLCYRDGADGTVSAGWAAR